MKGHLLKNHSALLRKSKAATHASRSVLDRLEDYESKGIITSAKAESFRRTLNEKNYSPLYIQKINKELDRYAGEKQNSTTTSSDQASLSVKTVPSYSTGSTVNTSVKSVASPTAWSQAGASDVSTKTSSTASLQWHSILQTKSGYGSKKAGPSKHISWEDQSTSTEDQSTLKSVETSTNLSLKPGRSIEKENASVESRSTNNVTKRRVPNEGGGAGGIGGSHNSGKRLILDLSDMKIAGYNKPFNEKETKQLFVEMCFYARLGFTQPPCCLHCSYRESVKEFEPLPDCSRWTVWRHNANQLLHPCDIEDNILVVQCHAARRLLEGETIEGYSWNALDSILEHVDSDCDDDED